MNSLDHRFKTYIIVSNKKARNKEKPLDKNSLLKNLKEKELYMIENFY